MADDKFSLKFTAVKEGWLTFGDIRSVDLNTPVASIAPSGGLAAQPKDRLPGLDRALDTLSADIGLLVTSLDALNLTLSSQRLRQVVTVSQAAGTKGEQKVRARQAAASSRRTCSSLRSAWTRRWPTWGAWSISRGAIAKQWPWKTSEWLRFHRLPPGEPRRSIW